MSFHTKKRKIDVFKKTWAVKLAAHVATLLKTTSYRLQILTSATANYSWAQHEFPVTLSRKHWLWGNPQDDPLIAPQNLIYPTLRCLLAWGIRLKWKDLLQITCRITDGIERIERSIQTWHWSDFLRQTTEQIHWGLILVWATDDSCWCNCSGNNRIRIHVDFLLQSRCTSTLLHRYSLIFSSGGQGHIDQKTGGCKWN